MPRRSPFALVGLVAAVLALVASSAVPAAGQEDKDPFIAPALQRVQAAQEAAHAAAAQVAATEARQAEVQARVGEVQARIADVQAKIPVLEAQARALRELVRRRAAALYASGRPDPGAGFVLAEPPLVVARRQILAAAATRRDRTTIRQLDEVGRMLAALRAELDAQQRDLDAQRAELASVQQRLVAEQAALDRKVAEANALLQRARAIGALRARGEPVLGPSLIPAAQLAGFVRARHYTPRIAVGIDELAQTFVEEASAEGVRAELAFAQSIVETGGFASAPANNYAGLGWCDSCPQGTRFPTPRDGIRAQVQHLRNYADPGSRAVQLAHPPSAYWYDADPAKAAKKFDTFFAKGWAETWNDMGHGNWATDPGYAGKVLRVYHDLVAFAQGLS